MDPVCGLSLRGRLTKSRPLLESGTLIGVDRPSDMVARPASPNIDNPLKPLVVTEGETAKFMVKMNGEPPPTVTWFINDVAVYNVSQSPYLP